MKGIMLIVGHPHSGYPFVEQLLRAHGMAPAQSSHRTALSPEAIGAHLYKAQGLTLEDCAEIQPVIPGAIWQGLALDLLLANIDQDFWGWADPQAIGLLDYWKETDSRLRFVLSYGAPEQAYTALFGRTAPTVGDLERAAAYWRSFHAALLHFYHRNTERCLLVQTDQIRAAPGAFIDQVSAWCGVRLPEASALPEPPPPADALQRYLAQALIRERPDLHSLYEELQASAALPLADAVRVPVAPLDAWRALSVVEQRTKELAQTLKQAEADRAEQARLAGEQQQENELLLVQLHQVQEELEQQFLERQHLSQVRAAAEQRAKELAQALKQAEAERAEQARLAVERQQRLDELSQVRAAAEQRAKELAQALKQAETERAEQARLAVERQQRLDELSQVRAAAEQRAKELAQALKQAETERDQQSARPAATELQEENELLLVQLHQVQEELEQQFLECQRLKQQLKPSAQSGHKNANKTASPPQRPPPKADLALYGAADRVKQQLSYRLGATMIAQSRSLAGWLGMPRALIRQAREFKRDRKAQQGQRLPPIAQYRDAHEADRVKQHLSYRLGATMIANARSPVGWLKMPWLLRREVRDFRRQRAAR